MKVDTRDDIPLPAARYTGTAAGLRSLTKVGQSVLLPISNHYALGPAAASIGLTGKYTARKVEGGIRVWRIKE